MLLDPESGSTHALNAIGRVFWSELDGRTSLEELLGDLANALGAPIDDLAEPVLGWALVGPATAAVARPKNEVTTIAPIGKGLVVAGVAGRDDGQESIVGPG